MSTPSAIFVIIFGRDAGEPRRNDSTRTHNRAHYPAPWDGWASGRREDAELRDFRCLQGSVVDGYTGGGVAAQVVNTIAMCVRVRTVSCTGVCNARMPRHSADADRGRIFIG